MYFCPAIISFEFFFFLKIWWYFGVYVFGGLQYLDRSTASTKYSTNLNLSGTRRIAFKMPCILFLTTNPLDFYFSQRLVSVKPFSYFLSPVFQKNSSWLKLQRMHTIWRREKKPISLLILNATPQPMFAFDKVSDQTRKCTELDQNSCVGLKTTSRSTQPNGASINFPPTHSLFRAKRFWHRNWHERLILYLPPSSD